MGLLDGTAWEKEHGTAATRGHCAGNGGLRGHSVGELFPCVIYQKGIPGAITWWVRQPNGVDAGPHLTYDDAAASAHSFNTGGDDWQVIGVYLKKVRLNEDKDTGETNAESFTMYEEIPFDCYGLYCWDVEGHEYHLSDYDRYAAAQNAYATARSLLPVGSTTTYRTLLRALNA
ncbi:hypothetical protein AXI70_gp05 [Cronobacter phage Dev-CD-23823]|uniref:Uncharacterized protein n=1 Tax=Cronobacter phage Dev-CD-23823 TaxID=1712539 RepID=A0A0K8IXZ9_9CAUD|nr:hypothetical protein AXI70_gp05 [Cronobacter phage Dev-CD-23823]CUH74580.1 hypothetical protein [Cronobacter phage Dev-CD-23823]